MVAGKQKTPQYEEYVAKIKDNHSCILLLWAYLNTFNLKLNGNRLPYRLRRVRPFDFASLRFHRFAKHYLILLYTIMSFPKDQPLFLHFCKFVKVTIFFSFFSGLCIYCKVRSPFSGTLWPFAIVISLLLRPRRSSRLPLLF